MPLDDIDLTEDSAAAASSEGSSKVKRPFSKLAIELDEEDLNSKGVHKLLLAQIHNLESDSFKLEALQTKYHEADKDRAILKEAKKSHTFSEILYSISLGLGTALIGLMPSIKSDSYGNLIVLIFGFILSIGAIIAKVKSHEA